MKLLRSRKALSTVVTTLIILVVSVLLATVVTFYAINVTTFLTVEGYYIANGNESTKTVRLACNIFNENKPAKAKK